MCPFGGPGMGSKGTESDPCPSPNPCAFPGSTARCLVLPSRPVPRSSPARWRSHGSSEACGLEPDPAVYFGTAAALPSRRLQPGIWAACRIGHPPWLQGARGILAALLAERAGSSAADCGAVGWEREFILRLPRCKAPVSVRMLPMLWPREEQSCSLPSPPFPWHLAVTHTSQALPAHSGIKAFWERN